MLHPGSPSAKYEEYREAWHLMREALDKKEEIKEDANNVEEPAEPERLPRTAMERMEASFRFVKRQLER